MSKCDQLVSFYTIHHGLSGQTIAYNGIDLVKNIARDGTVLVNYSYLADRTKAETKRKNE